MKKHLLCLLVAAICYLPAGAQSDFSVKFSLKNLNDAKLMLVRYNYNKQYIEDTSEQINNGVIEFKGRKNIDKGMYAVVSPGMVKYFDILINESQVFTITGDLNDLAHTLSSPDSKENQLMFSYTNFMASKEIEFRGAMSQGRGKSKPDSINLVAAKQATINKEVKKFESSFTEKNKGTFVYDILNLRSEKYPVNTPLAKNGRPDSIYQYYYYKNHFLDGINFKDDRIVRTPFFADRITRYLEQIIVQHPDTVIKEIDKILAKCNEGNLAWNSIIGDFTYKFEQNKTISYDRKGQANSFEKVFVHMADNYIVNDKTKAMYDDETVSNIIRRVNILRNLLPESKMPEIFLIDTVYAPLVQLMGFDTVSSSKSLTDLYMKHSTKLVPMFKTLYQVNAKYTVLAFWAVDCEHCKQEMPKLQENLKKVPGVAIQVVAVQTKDDMYEEWKKFITVKNLNFIHLYDPVHMNDMKEKFDITSTPVIYLLDRDKKIKGKKLTADQVVDVIRSLERIEGL